MKEPSKPSTVEELFTIHELRAAYWAGVNGRGFDEWHRKFQEMYPKESKPSQFKQPALIDVTPLQSRIKELEATNLALIARMQELEERRALVARNRNDFIVLNRRFQDMIGSSTPSEESQEELWKRSQAIGLLERYSKFLEEQGYLDTDWRAEHPYAIDVFLSKAPLKNEAVSQIKPSGPSQDVGRDHP